VCLTLGACLLSLVPVPGCVRAARPMRVTPEPRASPVRDCARPGEPPSRTAVEMLVEGQRAYLERGDTKPFSALLLTDVEVLAGRSRTPDAFDFPFSKGQLDALYRWAAANEGQFRAEFTTLEVDAAPTWAKVELELRYSKPTGERAAFGQRFELACSAGAWRVAHFRYWPLDPVTGREFTAFFQETDARIQQDLEASDLRDAAYRMMLAYRFNECAGLARRLTTDDPGDAWSWELRAKASALIGAIDDAEQSLQKARSLAPPAP
jgi:hypothetical protein